MVAPLSGVPQEGFSVFSLFSLIKLHLASLPLASSYSRVAVSSVFCAQNIFFFGPNAWGPVKQSSIPEGQLNKSSVDPNPKSCFPRSKQVDLDRKQLETIDSDAIGWRTTDSIYMEFIRDYLFF